MNIFLSSLSFTLLVWIAFCLVLMLIMENIKRFTYFGMSLLWFDFWIGIYYDREKRFIYINPVPCMVFKWRYGGITE
jgi:hypothetical protein